MNFLAVEVESQRYRFCPEVRYPVARLALMSEEPKPPFRVNFLHDLESEWWTAMWILFYHTDGNSPAEDLDAQLECFNKAFPPMTGLVSRSHFFTLSSVLQEAYQSLSPTYRNGCFSFIALAFHLRKFYERAEKTFPVLSLDDDLLEDAHKQVSQAHSDVIEELKGSNVYLQPLCRVLRRKRTLDCSHGGRVAKKRRVAE